jgi:hypothetical protein
MRLIQFRHLGRLTVGKVLDHDTVQLADTRGGVYALAMQAAREHIGLEQVVTARLTEQRLPYQKLVDEQQLLAPLIHPDPNGMLVSGTGLTHMGSAASRAAMHAKLDSETDLTDSMRMFKLGIEGGRPPSGVRGAQPEWFYKGDGGIVIAPEQPLPVPAFAEDAGEEPELVGLYVVGELGEPLRVGFALGNEFSDHVTERFNYLWLAHSKLRYCSFGPELLVGQAPASIEGMSRIAREGKTIWEKPFFTGEANMCHSLANLEHHHFKYAQFLRPGCVHVHYFGTATLSFADGIKTKSNDRFEIEAREFGRPLRNPIAWRREEHAAAVSVRAL